MEIKHDYHAHSGNYRPGGNSCQYIVVHNTGGSAGALNEAKYAHNNQHPSSYHYVLDGSNCYQILDDTDTAWAVGAWAGYRQIIRNNQSISIEVCSPGTEFTQAEKEQLRELVGILMKRHGIDADHVVRHYDCHTGHKDCPAYYSAHEDAWYELKAYITEEGDEDIVTPEDIEKIASRVRDYLSDKRIASGPCIIEPYGSGCQYYFDGGSKLVKLTHPDQREALNKAFNGTLPSMVMGEKNAPWFNRLMQACGYQSKDEIPVANGSVGL